MKDSETVNTLHNILPISSFPHIYIKDTPPWQSRFYKAILTGALVVKFRGLSVRASQSLLGTLTESAIDLKTAPASKGLFVDSDGAHVLPLKPPQSATNGFISNIFHSSPYCSVEYYTAIHL